MQRRMYIKIGDMAQCIKSRELPADAKVTLSIEAFAIFGISPIYAKSGDVRPIRWSEFVSAVHKVGITSKWTSRLQDAIISTYEAPIDLQNNISFISQDKESYRSLITRYKIYRNGVRKYFIGFVRALDRRLDGDDETSIVLIALVIASRFRFMFYEANSPFRLAYIETLSAEELQIAITEMRNGLDQMVQEGARLGLETREQVISFFGSEHSALIRQFFDIWEKFRESLYSSADKYIAQEEEECKRLFLASFAGFLDRMRVVNSRFIALCLEKYGDIM